MDRIVLEGLEVRAHHGVLDAERALGQRFEVDVTLELDLATAAATGDVGDTVDYGALARAVHDLVAAEAHPLIETVAEDVARLCLGHDVVTAVTVVVHKPSAPIAVPFRDVRVEVRRQRGAP